VKQKEIVKLNVTVSDADLRAVLKSHESPGVREMAREILRLRRLIRDHSRFWNGFADAAPFTQSWVNIARRHATNLAAAVGGKPARVSKAAKGGRKQHGR
jgi:hypothetical protein